MISPNNSIKETHPQIAKRWHPTKNGDKKPEDFTPGSHEKIWWICLKSEHHDFPAKIYTMTHSKSAGGCPYCSGKKVTKEKSLAFLFPNIAKEWHPTENGNKKPEDFLAKSNEEVWWLCPKSKYHEYPKRIDQRTRTDRSKKGEGCPFCSGTKICRDNNLAFLFPEIAKEWHPTKNGDKKPEDFTPGSHQKAWWLCPKKHAYPATLNSRTSMKSGCGKCSPQSSSQNVRIYSEIQFLFDTDELEYSYRTDGWEMDLFIPKINLVIEYDSYYWHKDNEKRDLKKNHYLGTKKIKLLRLREEPLPLLKKSDLSLKKGKLRKSDLNNIIRYIGNILPNTSPIKKKIAYYIEQKNFINEDIYKKTLAVISLPDPSKSIINTHPKIARDWDYKRNYPLLPDHYTQGSHEKIWWKCKNCQNTYQSQICDRTRSDKRQRNCSKCKN